MVRIFERMQRVNGENALSEALAICLEASVEFQKRFIQKTGFNGDGININIETRKPDTNSKKIPDITISGENLLLLLEIKEHARLYPDQWNNYRKIAAKSDYDPNKSVFAIVAPWANIEDGIEPKSNIFRWTDIHEMADEASKVESDEVNKFLLQELTTFLAGRNMMPFDGFVQQDIDTINKIPDVGKKLKNFFLDVFNKLSQRSSKSVVVQKGTVVVKTAKDYPELYVWVEFHVILKKASSKTTFNMWIGIQEYQVSGPILALGVWTGRMWTSKAERDKWQIKLKGLGFKWDEASDGGFVRVLQTKLKPSGSDPDLPGRLFREVQEIKDKVCDRL